MTADRLKHLPDSKRRDLDLAVKILFDSFDDAVKTKLSAKRKSGQILKVILFGSMARGDWVDDKLSSYKSDYDLLAVVNSHTFTDLHEYWHGADERFVREFSINHNIDAPVNFIVHDLSDVNNQLARGRPFFTDCSRKIQISLPRKLDVSVSSGRIWPCGGRSHAGADYERYRAGQAGDHTRRRS